MNTHPQSSDGPKVRVTPVFKAGETVVHTGTGAELKILEVTREGNLRCEGFAALIVPQAVEKKS